MQTLYLSLQPLFTKIGEIFDLFDLSFFVAGGSSLLAFLWLGHLLGIDLGPGALMTDGALLLLLLMVAVWGLVSYAVSTLGHKVFWNRFPSIRRVAWGGIGFDACFRAALQDHGLAGEGGDDVVNEHLARDGALHRLYTRFWTEVREQKLVYESFALLKRARVLTTSFDALATSGLLWAGVFALEAAAPPSALLPNPLLAAGLSLASLIFGACCAYEASRSRTNQLEELVATVAYLRREQARGAVADPTLGLTGL